MTAVGDASAEMTIDELARRAGTTTRNVRAYRERGLLPPPKLVGRTSYYDQAHLARLRHIAQLAERGFSLASIKELFAAWESGYGLSEVLGFEEALDADWTAESGVVLTMDQAVAVFGDPDAVDTALRAGLLADEGDDCYRLRAPRVLELGTELMAAGVPLHALLHEAETLNDDLDRIARRWTAMFNEHVWAGYVKRGMPPAELHDLTELLKSLRPLVGSVFVPLLGDAIGRHSNQFTVDALAGPASVFEPPPDNATAPPKQKAAKPRKKKSPPAS